MNVNIKYIGCDDANMHLFESQYATHEGMCYKNYQILDEKVAVMDTVDRRKTNEWQQKLSEGLEDRVPDYLVVQHMEPDHSGSIAAFLRAYQNRVEGVIWNGTWAPSAGKAMRTLIDGMKNVTVVAPMVTIRSAMKESAVKALKNWLTLYLTSNY